MNRFFYLASLLLVSVAVSSCGAKTVTEYADEYNALVTKLHQTTDSAARNEILSQISTIQLDARSNLKKDEYKEFVKQLHSITDTISR